ncbi:MAG: type IV toxin-antitoxin system AbiEi family antitoxin domain-containing protein [Gemmatimonadaceae bacterium]
MPTNRHRPRRRLSEKDQILALARRTGILRPRDLTKHGLSREILRRLYAEGKLERRGRGLYITAGADLSERETLAAASARIPHGVVCLVSALRFHELTTQNPADVWLAIDRKARAPHAPELPLHIVRFSGEALSAGIEEHRIDGIRVRIYCPAKTVADCFKYRRKIGLDVALEALRDYLRMRRGSVDNLWRFAAVCRVTNVMRPYLEASV